MPRLALGLVPTVRGYTAPRCSRSHLWITLALRTVPRIGHFNQHARVIRNVKVTPRFGFLFIGLKESATEVPGKPLAR
jgi:hypothetical protein